MNVTSLPSIRPARCLVLFLGCALLCLPAAAQNIVERHTVFSSGQETPYKPRAWNMKMERAPGGRRERGICLWFNTDHQARPWAGVRFRADNAPTFTVTDEWIEKGFIRFLLNRTLDRHGNIGGGDAYQIRPLGDPGVEKFQALRSQFVDRGRGIDQEADTWQEVLVPLKYFTDIKPGHTIGGFSFQNRNHIELTYSLDDIAYVRYDRLPDWMVAQLNRDVKQAWVTWPAYEHLPAAVKADRRAVSVRDGAFVYPDGSRAFLLNPYAREDARGNYGNADPERLPPTWDLYDRRKHGWIYDEIPSTEILCRLGFNSYSVTPAPAPWYAAVGYGNADASVADEYLASLARRIALPFVVDTVSWPWTLGKPGRNIDRTRLPTDAATVGRNHWTQYRIIGAGRTAWLDLWALNARRYRDAGARVVAFELMNEPAYRGESADHHAEFAQWLKQRYGSVAAVNRTWGTDYASLADAAACRFSDRNRPPGGQTLDYDEYLAGRFTELIAAGVVTVNGILPDTLVGLQPMGGYLRTPRESVWKHRIAQIETMVLTPTGGGRWTRGSAAPRPGATLTTHPMADAPIENDLLLAVSGEKMIVDNETYLRGQTRAATRNRLWEHVVCGLDGLTVFSWSKRGWVWWKKRADVQVDADKYPYSSLIPLARRTDALRGILDFSAEIQALAPRILPKPWGPAPKIGLVYSWDNARRRAVAPDRYDKLPAYYAALRYSHWNMTILPSDTIIASGIPPSVEVVVAGGLTHVERGLPAAIRRFVARGGILVLGECDFTRDIHGRPLPANAQFVADLRTGADAGAVTAVSVRPVTDALFPGKVKAATRERLSLRRGISVVLKDAQNHPVVVRLPAGNGAVYYQAADAHGYSLAKILHAIIRHAGRAKAATEWVAARITEKDGRLSPNIVLSRRSYGDRHALLLHNRDQYTRAVRVAVPGLTGDWTVRDALSDAAPVRRSAGRIGDPGIDVTLAPGGPAVLLIER